MAGYSRVRVYHINRQRSAFTETMSPRLLRDPLCQLYESDEAIMDLKTSPAALEWAYVRAYLWFTLLLPCFIPHTLMVGTPCALCGLSEVVKESCNAAKLTLRGKSLLYRRERAKCPFDPPGQGLIAVCNLFYMLNQLEVVFPLDDDGLSLEILSAESCAYGVESLVVKLRGIVAISIECPKNGKDFIKAFEEQQRKTEQTSSRLRDVSHELYEVHRSFIELFLFPFSEKRLLSRQKNDFFDKARKYEEQLQNLAQANNYVANQVVDEKNVKEAAEVAPIPIAEMVRDDAIPNSQPLMRMTTDDVISGMRSIGLEQYAGLFKSNGIDGSTMSVMDDASLKEMGIDSSLDRKKILGWVIKISQAQG